MAGTGDVTAASISLSGAWSGKTGPSGSWNGSTFQSWLFTRSVQQGSFRGAGLFKCWLRSPQTCLQRHRESAGCQLCHLCELATEVIEITPLLGGGSTSLHGSRWAGAQSPPRARGLGDRCWCGHLQEIQSAPGSAGEEVCAFTEAGNWSASVWKTLVQLAYIENRIIQVLCRKKLSTNRIYWNPWRYSPLHSVTNTLQKAFPWKYILAG